MYLFQLRSRGVVAAVAEVLAAEPIVKAGVGLADDLKALKKVMDFAQKSTVDLGAAATRTASSRPGCAASRQFSLAFAYLKDQDLELGAAAPHAPADRIRGDRRVGLSELYVRFRTLGWV